MKLGVFAVLFGNLSFTEMLDKVADSGLEAVEIGCGGHPGKAHCDPAQLLNDKTALLKFREEVASRGLEISALSVHGNPLHPNQEVSVRDHADFVDAVHLAEELGVSTVNTFSGCPGESEHSLHPSWVTCPWPNEYAEVLQWQWDEKVLPYWSRQNEFVKTHGIRVAIEPHPGFVVYNTETCLRLHEGAGEHIGINFDPSHLFWQQMDPIAGIKALAKAGALFHVHAKDTGFDDRNMAENGVLDTKPYSEELDRSWIFRTVGYGHGEETWRQILSTLQMVGYNGVLSIEHEDSLMSVEEGFSKAVSFLQHAMIRERIGEMWWA